MKLFDSHCHLDDGCYATDFEQVLARAAQADVHRMLLVGIDGPTSARALELARGHAGLYASVGVHPHDAKVCSEALLSDLAAMAADPKVVAWGETGLDFNRMHSPVADQERWFVRQLEMADSLDLPLIFHERDSDGRLLALLKATPAKTRRGVVHCFSGSRSELEAYLAMGFCIGITGIVTHKLRGEELRALLPAIPGERLLVETDAPYLTPSPERNKHRRNEPAFVRQVLHKVAEVRGEAVETLADQVWQNTCGLFGLDAALAAQERSRQEKVWRQAGG